MMRSPVLFGLLLGLSPLFGIASAEETALDLVALKNADFETRKGAKSIMAAVKKKTIQWVLRTLKPFLKVSRFGIPQFKPNKKSSSETFNTLNIEAINPSTN